MNPHEEVDFSAGWAALRDVTPPSSLWPRIRARSAARPPKLLWRLAAGFVGFAGVAGAMAGLEVKASPEPWVESLTPLASSPATSTLFASVPEYQLLAGFPRMEDGR
jgi:hypothetical protein